MPEEMGIFEVMFNCRAMRRLDQREVPKELLVKLVNAANQAPSGSNMQNGRWIIVRDKEVRQQLADLNRQAVEAYLAPLIDNPGSLPHQSEVKRKRMVDAVVWQKEHMCLVRAGLEAASGGFEVVLLRLLEREAVTAAFAEDEVEQLVERPVPAREQLRVRLLGRSLFLVRASIASEPPAGVAEPQVPAGAAGLSLKRSEVAAGHYLFLPT